VSLSRRSFLGGVAALGAVPSTQGVLRAPGTARKPSSGAGFKLQYAPHFGMFASHAGDDPIAQLQFMADEGFAALEDNWMSRRPPEQQQEIAREMQRLNMEMGVFVAHAEFSKVTFASGDAGARERIEADMQSAVEVAKRVGARWCTVVPGTYAEDQEWDYQTAQVIENLKRAAAICEPHGLVMVIESLNPWTDHPGLFLTKIPQAYMLCRAVDSPSCKILDDLYHQQISEGNLIPNIDRAWSEIAYFQVGDNPGRKEPTTGEINFRNVFRYIHGKGFEGIVGMEHGNSKPGKEGERALIEAYRACDDF
jgi:hydroxypyruvate isomerase